MSKIIITGASGFVGSNLLEFFKSTHELQPLSIRYIPKNKIELSGDVIIHLSGKAHDLKKTASSKEYYDINTELTKSIYNYFLQSNSKLKQFLTNLTIWIVIILIILTIIYFIK